MPTLTRPKVRALIHDALVARVRILLGQSGFDDLLSTQERVSLALARGASPLHARSNEDGGQALAQAVIDALGLDANYYNGTALDVLIVEGLSSAGLVLAEIIRGHEQDSRARWQAQVVPQFDRVEEFLVALFDGRWAQGSDRQTLVAWMQRGA